MEAVVTQTVNSSGLLSLIFDVRFFFVISQITPENSASKTKVKIRKHLLMCRNSIVGNW